MNQELLLRQVLFYFGVGFFAANLKVLVDLLRFRSRRSSALLVWPGQKPRFYGVTLLLGALLGVLVVFKLFVLGRPPSQLFGESMMLLYYGYAVPLSTRISRGFYRDGVWSDTGFIRWGQISAVSWREDTDPTLVLVSHLRSVARRLRVPGHLYGQARRLLHDRIKAQEIHFGGTGLDLGSRSEADAV
jgi:hypothetical protein